ncbi:MAG: hypothetical protein ACRDPR_09410, partial [Nocardioidaceae bacterium]
ASYHRAWEDHGGVPLDPWESATGQALAKALSDAMFVGAVAERDSPDIAATMLDSAQAALDRLGRLLSNHD